MRRLKDFEPITSQVMQVIAKDTSFSCRPSLGEIFQTHDKVIFAISHSTPLSWLPAMCLLTAHACARGGGARKPLGIMDRFFFTVPGLRYLAQQITQADGPMSFAEIADSFKHGDGNDLVIFPEGSNCFFGHPEDIQEFRSPRFMELAIRSGAPIVIAVHRGSEGWAKAVPLDESTLDKIDFLPKIAADFLQNRLRKTGLLTFPLWPKPMEKFAMLCELYHPKLKVEDLKSDPQEQVLQIREEAELVRMRMRELLTELDMAKSN
jgi:hypothetical protein